LLRDRNASTKYDLVYGFRFIDGKNLGSIIASPMATTITQTVQYTATVQYTETVQYDIATQALRVAQPGVQPATGRTNPFTEIWTPTVYEWDEVKELLTELVKAKREGRVSAFDTIHSFEAAIRRRFTTMPDIIAEQNLAALQLATLYGEEGIGRLLLEMGVDVNAKSNKVGLTALHMAVKCGREGILSLLLEKGADINAKSTEGLTVLHFAASWGWEGLVYLLLEKGAHVDAVSKLEETALHMTAYSGHERVVMLLLGKGAEIDAKTYLGQTALFIASVNGQEAVVRRLLENGADFRSKIRNPDGTHITALGIAAWKGHKGIVQLLLHEGADVRERSSDGATPAMYAKMNGHMAVVRLLQDQESTCCAVM
jgi:ankyrin repeat protein